MTATERPVPEPMAPPAPPPDRAFRPSLGIVAIGRNEGARLERCLVSARAAAARVVYVDSGSTDGSVALAERLGVTVVHLDAAAGFTAGKARNLGFAALGGALAGPGRPAPAAGIDPPAMVQFVDGDCEIVAGWIDAATARLAADPGLAAVAGRRRERHPDASLFNRHCDMEWDTAPGPAAAVGGDALYRSAAFAAAGGFDPGFICGEEPELCFRLRRAGWRIERLDAEMTLHDAAMTRVSQWWRRTLRAGWAFAEGAATHGASPERYNRREAWRSLFWGGAVPGAIAALLALAGGLALAGLPGWGWALGAAGLGALAYPAMALRIARSRRRDRGDGRNAALAYGALVMLGKPAECLGALRYHRSRARGQTARIIEYKTG